MAANTTFPLTRRFHIVLYLVALLAVGAFAYVDENVTPLVLAGGAAFVAWLLTDSPAAQGVMAGAAVGWGSLFHRASYADSRAALRTLLLLAPRLIANLAVLIAAVILAARVYLYVNGPLHLIMELGGFLVVLIGSKLFERKTVRNVSQVLVLSLLLVVSATMFSNSTLFFFAILAAYFFALAYLVVLLTLFLDTLQAGTTAMVAHVPGAAGGGGGGGAAAQRTLRRDLGNVAKHCAFLVLPVAAACFTFVPRTRGNPLLGTNWGGPAIQTGFTETMHLPDRGQITPSDAEVMHVTLSRDGQDISGEFTDLYFRGAVLDEYDADTTTWSHNPADAKAEVPPLPQLDGIQVDITLLRPGRKLFVLAPFLVVWQNPSDAPRFLYDPAYMTLQDSFVQTRGGEPLKYTLNWLRDLPMGLKDTVSCPVGLLRAARFQYLPGGHIVLDGGIPKQVPAVMVPPQIAAKAHEILRATLGDQAPAAGQAVDPDQIRNVVNLFAGYLRRNYRYSLTIRTSDPKLDPTADFLLHRGIHDDDTGGHCEYFASALVMLCRSVGINARVVTGYHGGEFSTLTNEFIVKEKYAHAWAEVCMPDEGWVLCDASPIGSNLDTTAGSGRFFNDMLQLIQSAWSAVVVNFDNESRAAVTQWLAARYGDFVNADFPAWTTLLMWAVVGLLVIFFVLLRRRFRRLRPLLESTQGQPHRQLRLSNHVVFLEDLLHLFERGRVRPPDQTPLEFLQPHLARLGPAAPDARWLVDTAYGVRFGGLHLTPALRQQIALALKHVKSAVRPGTLREAVSA